MKGSQENSFRFVLMGMAEVFRKPVYVVVAALVSYAFLIFSSILPNIQLLRYMFGSPAFSFGARAWFLLSLKGLATSATSLNIILLIVISILTGINIALVVYFMKRRLALVKSSGATFIGIIAALLGLGCASCGSVLITTVFGLGASSAVIGFLPFNGREFSYLAILLLLFSIYTVAKKIAKPIVC